VSARLPKATESGRAGSRGRGSRQTGVNRFTENTRKKTPPKKKTKQKIPYALKKRTLTARRDKGTKAGKDEGVCPKVVQWNRVETMTTGKQRERGVQTKSKRYAKRV